MISGGHLTPGKTFWKNHVSEHEATHGYDLEELSRINLPVHVEENKLAKLYRTNKYRVKLPVTTKNLLLHFLEETADDGGQTLLSCLNQHLELISLPGRASLFVRGAELQEGEGIVGHTSGRGDLSENLPNVKLGMLPMDKELMKEVEEELREEDTKMKDISRSDELGVTAGKSLIDEFSKIKREEGEDSPAREAIPLPPYTIADVEDEVRQVKEYREKVQIKGGPSPALPSVCMYTFHNTNDGYFPQKMYLPLAPLTRNRSQSPLSRLFPRRRTCSRRFRRKLRPCLVPQGHTPREHHPLRKPPCRSQISPSNWPLWSHLRSLLLPRSQISPLLLRGQIHPSLVYGHLHSPCSLQRS
jgi:hypothetical protein